MNTDTRSPGKLLAALTALVKGLEETPPEGLTHVAAGGTVLSIEEVKTEAKGYIAVYKKAEATAIEHAKAVQERKLLAPHACGRYNALEASFKAAMGKNNPDLIKLGFEPNKTPTALTVDQKKASVAKGQATRVVRGTKGKRQKAALKGKLPEAPPPQGTTTKNGA